MFRFGRMHIGYACGMWHAIPNWMMRMFMDVQQHWTLENSFINNAMRYCLRYLQDSVLLLLMPAGNYILTTCAFYVVNCMLNYNPTPSPSFSWFIFNSSSSSASLFLDFIDFYASVSFRIINEIISNSVCKLSDAIVIFVAIMEDV